MEIVNDDVYDLFIEFPVRDACKILKEKGIKTLMSSANKEDATSKNHPINFIETLKGNIIFIGQNTHFNIGNGFAWIMIDFESLVPENKELIFKLNSGEIELQLNNDALKRLNDNCLLNHVKCHQRELIKLYRVIDKSRFDILPLRLLQYKNDDYFTKNHEIIVNKNSLSYNGWDYKAVVLRYPIDEKTKVDEITEYFNNIVEKFKNNIQKKIR